MTELRYSKTEKKNEFKLLHVRACTYVTAPYTDGIGEKKSSKTYKKISKKEICAMGNKI